MKYLAVVYQIIEGGLLCFSTDMDSEGQFSRPTDVLAYNRIKSDWLFLSAHHRIGALSKIDSVFHLWGASFQVETFCLSCPSITNQQPLTNIDKFPQLDRAMNYL